MRIEMKKFGTLLNSRPAGSEAASRLFQIINGTNDNKIVIDFDGVEILTPSFADEFLTQIEERYSTAKTIKIINTNTKIVKETLKAIGKN